MIILKIGKEPVIHTQMRYNVFFDSKLILNKALHSFGVLFYYIYTIYKRMNISFIMLL
jgi:hypothetical protein